MTRLALALALLVLGCTTAREPADLVIEAPRLVDVERGVYVEKANIVIRGDRIVEVTQRRVDAKERIALPANSVVLPGLIDAHVHLAWSSSDGIEDARKTLRAGFTTVRNLGSDSTADAALVSAIESGAAEGPRIVRSGAGLGSAGGICAQVFGPAAVVTNEESARAKVREQIAAGAAVIKLCAGGGVFAPRQDPPTLELEEPILAAIADEAHRAGRKVAAHAQGPRAIGAAARAGVDSIEHGGLIDDASADAMKARNVVLVPTLARLDVALANAPPANAEAAKRRRDAAYEQVRNAFARGVKIVLGTDGSVLPHGQNARELQSLVEIGMTPAQAIQAATIRAAELLGRDDVGVIRAGALADLIVVEGDPLADVKAFEKLKLIVKGGKAHSL